MDDELAKCSDELSPERQVARPLISLGDPGALVDLGISLSCLSLLLARPGVYRCVVS